MPNASSHQLTTSVIVADADRILLLCDSTSGTVRWRLPRGVAEQGEHLRAAARRGFHEEIGMAVSIGELAFVAEFLSTSRPPELHFGFVGRMPASDGDAKERPLRAGGPAEARFVPTGELRAHLTHRPLLIALESWLDERALRYHVFDLDRIPAEVV